MTTPPAHEPTPPAAPGTPGPPPASPDDQLSAFVARRATALHHRYVTDDPTAVAQLAVLRRAVTAAPGDDLAVHAIVFGGFPPSLLGRRDEPSTYEWTAHVALALFALHQQSNRNASMHRAGEGLGRALARLGRATSEEAVRRRFHALGTASTPAAALHHLRGLVTQLRTQGIPLDYGRLARDLRRLQDPRRSGSVRLAWGRDYHRLPTAGEATAATTDADRPATDTQHVTPTGDDQ